MAYPAYMTENPLIRDETWGLQPTVYIHMTDICMAYGACRIWQCPKFWDGVYLPPNPRTSLGENLQGCNPDRMAIAAH